MKPIEWTTYKNIVVLTGAGISAESGLPTYRGPGGLWTIGDTAKMSQSDIVESDPDSMWAFFGSLRPKILSVAPNAGHLALAQLEKVLSQDQKFTLITQNIDELHQRAGNRSVLELHGSLFKTRCSNSKCDLKAYSDDNAYEQCPRCDKCGAVLRPDVVLFGEPIPPDPEWHSKRALRNCDLFIAIGTSGTVSPASEFVRSAKYVGARTILINLDRTKNDSFDQQFEGSAGTILPTLIG